jgi:predicted DNA-binding transcriptional regulator YafY
MRADRLLSILLLLQSRGRLTAQALADEFEVSVRTVYRDIDDLSAAGIPVYADRGPGGGFQLLDGYRTRLTGLTAGEAETLLLAGLPGPAADLGLGEPLAMARLKLLAAVPAAAGEGAARVGDRFHLDPVSWYQRAAPPEHLPAIARAVWAQRRIVIRYESWSATVRRTVEPLGLVLKAGTWYLVARIGPDIRTYKVAKVLDLDVLADTFDPPAGFDLAAHWRGAMQRLERDLRQAEAVLRVSPSALSALDRLGADAADAVRQAPPDAAGWRQATVPIEGIDHAAGLLLGFADGVEVVAPPALRQALAGAARRVAALYGGEAAPAG